MTEKVQINLRAGADQKARWEAYVEETGRFASLSELIRASVEAEIQTEEAREETTPALSSDVQELKEELSTVRKHVAWLREQEQEAVDISALAQSVFDTLEPLPEVDAPIQIPEDVNRSREQYQRELRAKAVIEPETDESGDRQPQTASALADRLDTTPQRIEDAIEHLQDQFLPVTVVEFDGQRHYFRDE